MPGVSNTSARTSGHSLCCGASSYHLLDGDLEIPCYTQVRNVVFICGSFGDLVECLVDLDQ